MNVRFAALLAATGCAVAACASGTSGQHAASSPQPAASPAPSAPSVPTTAPQTTVTVTAPPTPSPTSTPTQTPVQTPAQTATASPSPQMGPAAVVSAFYAAINAQDYATAWRLGGSNLGAGYDAFAAGFASTAHDTLTITGVQGDTVSVTVEALLDDGTTQAYEGSYVVQNGVIVQGRLTQTTTTSSSPTTSPATSPTSVPRRGEFCRDADAGKTATDTDGNVVTCLLEDGRYHWH